MALRVPRLVALTDRVDREVRRSRAEVVHVDRRRKDAPGQLIDFVPWLSPELDAPAHLAPLCDELQRVLRGEQVQVCVSVPPRHGKSTTVHHLIAALLYRRPTARVLYASYDLDFAAENLRAIRRLVIDLGLAIGDVDRKEELRLVSGGGVMACGIQAPPTGRGFDLVIVDDPIRRLADALSRAIRDRIGQGFSADLYSRQSPARKDGARTSFVIVATRWHEDDLTGRQEALGWRVINLPAIGPDGRALAPKLFTADHLAEIRAQNEYVWHALYMGDPSPRVGRMFGDASIVESAPDSTRRVFGVDTSRTRKERSDRNAWVEMVEAGGQCYVVDFFAARMPLTDHTVGDRVVEEGFASRLKRALRGGRATPARAVQYTGGDEDLVLDLLARSDGVKIDAVRATSDKRFRAQPVAAAWNRGAVHVLDAPWTEAFVSRVLGFTGADGAEDEEVDCLAAAFDALQGGGGQIVAPSTSTRSQRLAIGVRRRWT